MRLFIQLINVGFFALLIISCFKNANNEIYCKDERYSFDRNLLFLKDSFLIQATLNSYGGQLMIPLPSNSVKKKVHKRYDYAEADVITTDFLYGDKTLTLTVGCHYWGDKMSLNSALSDRKESTKYEFDIDTNNVRITIPLIINNRISLNPYVDSKNSNHYSTYLHYLCYESLGGPNSHYFSKEFFWYDEGIYHCATIYYYLKEGESLIEPGDKQYDNLMDCIMNNVYFEFSKTRRDSILRSEGIK